MELVSCPHHFHGPDFLVCDRSGAVVPSARVPGQELHRHHLELVSTAKPGPLNQKLASNLFNKSPGDSDSHSSLRTTD